MERNLRGILTIIGLASVLPANSSHARQLPPIVHAAAAAPSTTILRRILLRDDKEPDVAGGAEIFAVVSGIGADRKAHVEIQPMPWLAHDKRWYHPNQVLIDWSQFSGGYVNVQLFEDDGATQLSELTKRLNELLGSVDTWLVGSPIEAARGDVQKIGELVFAAVRTRAFVNETDYVDSFYVIERGKKYLNHDGAAKNAMITLEPGGSAVR
jgi:hypothetical protein